MVNDVAAQSNTWAVVIGPTLMATVCARKGNAALRGGTDPITQPMPEQVLDPSGARRTAALPLRGVALWSDANHELLPATLIDRASSLVRL